MGSRRAGFTEEELLAAGLVQRSKSRPGSVYDRFRARIMFPAADARGPRARLRRAADARGAARAAPSTSTPPTASSTTSARCCSASIWRARHAAKAGRMLLVEGYTDVLALHQAGIRNAVGIMGTSLTEEQVDELAAGRHRARAVPRRRPRRAGRDAARRPAGRRDGSSSCGWWLLPEGSDPADLVASEGAEALRARVQASVPFVFFNVDRILERADTAQRRGTRPRARRELRPVVADLGPSVLRDELMRRIAGRLELSDAQLTSLLIAPAVPAGADRPPCVRRAAHERSARNGSAQAAPAADQPDGAPGAAVPGAVRGGARAGRGGAGPHRHRRAADEQRDARGRPPAAGAPAHAAGRPAAPATRRWRAPSPTSSPRPAGSPTPSAERLEHTRLVLELGRLERAINRARADGTGISALAAERERLREEMQAVVARLEKTL